MVSQMAHGKNLGELCMAHVENLYNIPCKCLFFFVFILSDRFQGQTLFGATHYRKLSLLFLLVMYV